MNRPLLFSAVLAAIAGLVVLAHTPRGVGQDEAQDEPAQTPTRLPGALAAIDASEFPTLQAAIDALPTEGGIVRLPAGTFEISQPLVVRGDDVCLQGVGAATHIKNVSQDGQPALILAHPEHADQANDRQHELWRVRLADFRITGNEQSGHGILARNVNEIYIEGVTVSYHGGDGIRLDYCYEDPRICECVLTYNKQTGLNLQGCHDIVVSANQFEENQDALHCFDGYNLCMTGNCLDDHLGAGVVVENTYGSVLSGNMIEECNGTAVVLDRDCYGIAISANVIAHNGAGVDLRDAHGCSVSANTFTIMKTAAPRVRADSGRIAVGGNSFSSSYIGDGKDKRAADDRTAAGIELPDASFVLAAGNVFSGVDPPAIVESSAADSTSVISNNLFVDTEAGVPTVRPSGLSKPVNFSD